MRYVLFAEYFWGIFDIFHFFPVNVAASENVMIFHGPAIRMMCAFCDQNKRFDGRIYRFCIYKYLIFIECFLSNFKVFHFFPVNVGSFENFIIFHHSSCRMMCAFCDQNKGFDSSIYGFCTYWYLTFIEYFWCNFHIFHFFLSNVGPFENDIAFHHPADRMLWTFCN